MGGSGAAAALVDYGMLASLMSELFPTVFHNGPHNNAETTTTTSVSTFSSSHQTQTQTQQTVGGAGVEGDNHRRVITSASSYMCDSNSSGGCSFSTTHNTHTNGNNNSSDNIRMGESAAGWASSVVNKGCGGETDSHPHHTTAKVDVVCAHTQAKAPGQTQGRMSRLGRGRIAELANIVEGLKAAVYS